MTIANDNAPVYTAADAEADAALVDFLAALDHFEGTEEAEVMGAALAVHEGQIDLYEADGDPHGSFAGFNAEAAAVLAGLWQSGYELVRRADA